MPRECFGGHVGRGGAWGGNLLSKTTREALNIIENKSKVRYSRNKPNASRMNTSRESVSKMDERIDKLADQLSTLVEIVSKKVVTPAPVKAVEETCITCSDAHSWYNCSNTDNNQASVCATTGTYNQVNPPNRVSNQMEPPDFAPVQNNGQNRFNNHGQGNNFNRGNNFHGNQDCFKNQTSIRVTISSNTFKTGMGEDESESPTRSGVVMRGPLGIVAAQIPPPVTPISIPESNVPKSLPKPNIPYPLRRDDQNLLMNKEKLLELAKIPLNKNCSAVLLKKLPKKLGDPDKFLIPCNFPGMDVCHALADLGASINLMPLSFWKKLSLQELTQLFHFPTDFVVVNFKADPLVPLILGRFFLRNGRALIDVYGEEITLRVDNEAITFNLDQTTRYSSTNDKSVNRIDIIDAVYEEYAPELLGFSNSSGEFPTCGTWATFFLVTVVRSNLSVPLGISLLGRERENDKLPVIIAKGLKNDVIAKGLKNDEKDALLKVLKSHKGAIAWKTTDIKGIDPRFYKPTVQSQRRVNPKIHEEIKKEVLKLLDAGMIYPISDSPWVSPVHCIPKKGGITVFANEENELISTRLVTKWKVCIDYRKLNEATRKDHFPLPFMDQMIERLAGNEFYCFLDGISGYFQIPIDPQDQEKITFTCPYGTFAYRRMPFGLCAPGHKISKSGIEVDRAKVDVIVKLPYPTTVKGVRSFLGHAGFYRQFILDFSKIVRPMTHLLEKGTPFVFSKDCIDAFQTLKKKLTEAPILVVPDWKTKT
ncbi:hypothetical protein Tco_0647590 [Tanacetum coccineum]